MKVHELIEILRQCEQNAEVIVDSHTLKHPSCKECIFERDNIRRLPGDIRPVRGVAADPHADPDWHTRHLSTCGTAFRGCDPECPKELAEQAMRP